MGISCPARRTVATHHYRCRTLTDTLVGPRIVLISKARKDRTRGIAHCIGRALCLPRILIATQLEATHETHRDFQIWSARRWRWQLGCVAGEIFVRAATSGDD